MTLEKSCPYCAGVRLAPWSLEKKIWNCIDCSLIFYAEKLDSASLYGEEYFQGGEYADYIADKPVAQKNFSQRIKDLKLIKPDGGKLLELGCAYGFFLELASQYWDCKGIDITPGGVKYAQSVLKQNAVQGDFLSMPDEPNTYDLICLWDTIEHLSQPFETIKKAGKWLKPGGSLVMTTGDISSTVARLRGEKWRLIHPPTHLYYFSPKTLGNACRREGLEVTHMSHPGYTRSFRSMLKTVFEEKNPSLSWLSKMATLGGRFDVPVYLNFHDIMMITAQKGIV